METSVRIDQWLWAARFFKSRSLAARAVELGRVRLGGRGVKPASALTVGAVLEIDTEHARFQVRVQQISSVRGPARVAVDLYQETPESLAQRQAEAERRRLFAEPTAALGRPDKRARRQLARAHAGAE